MEKTTKMCDACRDDFYNGRSNCDGKNECWLFEKATIVRRWKLGWWTSPVTRRAYREVETLSCFHQPGTAAFHKTLHPEAVEPIRLETS